MANNGILDLETYDNNEDNTINEMINVSESSLPDSSKKDILGILGGLEDFSEPVLPAKEQIGLEAATFATVIGQAKPTGNILGDLLSVAAQTGPAALATFKERQSIKEKEAEFKTKSLSLAAKLAKQNKVKEDFFIDFENLNKGISIVDFDTVKKFPGRFARAPRRGVNMTFVIDNETGKEIQVDSAEVITDILAEQYAQKFGKDYTKKYSYPDPSTTYYLQSERNPFKAKKTFRRSEWNLLPESEKQKYSTEMTGSQQAYDIQYRDKLQSLQADQEVALKEVTAAQDLLKMSQKISRDLLNPKAMTGLQGEIVLGIKKFGDFIKSSALAVSNNFYTKEQLKAVGGDANKLYQKDLIQADQDIREYLLKKGRKNLTATQRDILNIIEGDSGVSAKAQEIKSRLTQFVYLLAKARESGGKFSVPDIEFAFQSVGTGSSPTLIFAGLNTLVSDIVEQKVSQLKMAFPDIENNFATADIPGLMARDGRIKEFLPLLEYHQTYVLKSPIGDMPSTSEYRLQWEKITGKTYKSTNSIVEDSEAKPFNKEIELFRQLYGIPPK